MNLSGERPIARGVVFGSAIHSGTKLAHRSRTCAIDVRVTRGVAGLLNVTPVMSHKLLGTNETETVRFGIPSSH
eukprot:CAMPEP_0170420602 /NCGR_PEP_ID=MMETSP0117_2-20130122/35433_1 /TAXON_ID=400756 /ORGANISM="Durinskia baltica, Strain CSIRO CS-38" /LENGTH=73 /DNA_ID=CAMNT_0010679057 /DNA_START=66 /DNA_END=284 /DNA_ORIENTATION=-